VCTNKKNVNIKFNAHCVSGITLIRYGQTQNIQNPNNLKVFGSKNRIAKT
jgi:hypothetical protein